MIPKKCPFCGSDSGKVLYRKRDLTAKYECFGCGSSGPLIFYYEQYDDYCFCSLEQAEVEAIKRWNERC